MKQIKIADATLCREDSKFSFKEKLEIARQLEKLCVDVIELPPIQDTKTDILLVKTISSFVKKSTISVAAGSDKESIENAKAALVSAKKSRIKIQLPVSTVGMEYISHKRAPKTLEWVSEAVKLAKEGADEVEFCAVDASRAEKDFVIKAISAAAEAGADCVTICDTASEMMPDDFAKYIEDISKESKIPVSVSCDNKNGLALACAILAVRKGADCVKTAVDGEIVPLDTFSQMVRNCGNNYDFTCNIKITELNRIVKQIRWILGANAAKIVTAASSEEAAVRLDQNDSKEDVILAVKNLGYDLSTEDEARVYEEFMRVAEKKTVGSKELEAIVASTALQIPSTYQLVSYVINNGNIISSSAQITLDKAGALMQGVCIGDGPIDAAFLAIDQIIGRHYELDDFQIQSVTEGKEAMGSALVKLRANGKLYSGNGISTDIIGASIRAYLNAVNKIVYEEA